MAIVTGTIDRTLDTILKELKQHRYPINVVYDIGANDGRWWRKWKGSFKSDVQCYQFEANSDNRPRDLTTRFFNQVLSDEDGKKVKFYKPNTNKTENTGASYYKEMTPAYTDGKHVVLETKTLDTMIAEHNLPLPDFVKMDTQGSEVDILKGGSKAFKQCKAVICEVPVMYYNEGAPNFGDYVEAFYDLGFIASGVDHLAIRRGVFNQMDIVFVKREVLDKTSDYKARYIGF